MKAIITIIAFCTVTVLFAQTEWKNTFQYRIQADSAHYDGQFCPCPKDNDPEEGQPSCVCDGGFNNIYNRDMQIWLSGEFVGRYGFTGKRYVYNEDGLLEGIEIYEHGHWVANEYIDGE